jgi:hypothetical protein
MSVQHERSTGRTNFEIDLWTELKTLRAGLILFNNGAGRREGSNGVQRNCAITKIAVANHESRQVARPIRARRSMPNLSLEA